MENKNKAVAISLAAVLAAGCVPAVAFAQAASSDQVLTAVQSATLHDRVLAGETVYPEKGVEEAHGTTPSDGWIQRAYECDGKVVAELASSTRDVVGRLWTASELSEIAPDVLIIRDYDENTVWEIEAEWGFESSGGPYDGPHFTSVEGSYKHIKVDCIVPGELKSYANPWAYMEGTDKFGDRALVERSPVGAFDTSWYDDDDNYIGGDAGTLVIGKNVTSLSDFWASNLARVYNKVVFEKGSKLEHVGNACGLGDSMIAEIEGLPSSAKLNDAALGIPTLKKATDENGNDIKANENAWIWEGAKKSDAFPPAAPDYWKQQLKKVKSVSLSVKVKKGGKTSFAKVENVVYKKVKVTKLKGAKYKKTSKAQGKKATVSKAGKLTIKKGLKKGTYKVSVKATCKGHSKTVTATVKVK